MDGNGEWDGAAPAHRAGPKLSAVAEGDSRRGRRTDNSPTPAADPDDDNKAELLALLGNEHVVEEKPQAIHGGGDVAPAPAAAPQDAHAPAQAALTHADDGAPAPDADTQPETNQASGSQGLQAAVAEDDGAPKPWVADAKKRKGPRGVPKGCKETSSDTELPSDDSSEERHWSRYYESKGMLQELI